MITYSPKRVTLAMYAVVMAGDAASTLNINHYMYITVHSSGTLTCRRFMSEMYE